MKLRHDRPYPLSALAAPMAVWAVHFVVVYSLVGLACERGLLLRSVAMLPVLTWILALLTVAALATIAWLGWNALHRWRMLRASAGTPATPRSSEAFMRLATALLALLAFIAVVFTATPIPMLPPCAWYPS